MTNNSNQNRLIYFSIAAALIALIIAGIIFYRSDEKERNLGTPGHPVIVMLSAEHGKNLTAEDKNAIVTLLEDVSGLHFEILIASSPLESIESFGSYADVGIIGLFEYFLARQEYGVNAVLQIIRQNKISEYSGAIVVLSSSNIENIISLDNRTIAFAGPFSTSGFVFPAKLFKEKGIKTKNIFAGNHSRVLELLKNGVVDAGATYVGAIEDDTEVRIIAVTDSIPNEPLILRSDIRIEKQERIIEAFIKLQETDIGRKLLKKIADVEGFIPIENKNYDAAMKNIRRAGMTVYDLVPEGIQVESRRRGIEITF